MNEPQTSQRIDKWLWYARVVKTRTLAQKLVTGGKVRIDREKCASPSQKVVIGNVLTITLPRAIRILEIAAFANRRGPFAEAQALYKDMSPIVEESGKSSSNPADSGITVLGRPNKRDRKQALELKHKSN